MLLVITQVLRHQEMDFGLYAFESRAFVDIVTQKRTNYPLYLETEAQ